MSDVRASLRLLAGQPHIMWARLNKDGTLIDGVGVVFSERSFPGHYRLTFEAEVNQSLYQATVRHGLLGGSSVLKAGFATVQSNPFDLSGLLVITWSLSAREARDFECDVVVISGVSS